jgi:xanthine dehydrogenase YagR molybdenum-binding subunit
MPLHMPFAQEQEQPLKATKQLEHRYEGIAKVTGKARYAAEFSGPFPKPDLAYAYIVQANIPSGSVKSIDTASASRAQGVIAVITPFNAPKLSQGPPQPPARRNLTLLQDANVSYNGQPIAVVVGKLSTKRRQQRRCSRSFTRRSQQSFNGRSD